MTHVGDLAAADNTVLCGHCEYRRWAQPLYCSDFYCFVSINALLAALVGWIGLGQNLGWTEWASIGAIVAANTLSILARRI